MHRAVVIVFIFLQFPTDLSLMTEDIKVRHCAFNMESFWIVYRRHFQVTNTVSIRIIDTMMDHSHIDRVLKEFYRSTKLNSTLIIKHSHEHGHDDSEEEEDDSYSFDQEAIHVAPKGQFGNKIFNDEDLLEIKRETSDIQNGNILIVWNETCLLKYLEDNRSYLIGDTRSLYVVLFLSTDEDPDDNRVNSIGTALKIMWKEYDILNAIAQYVCSENNDIHIYDPFHHNLDGTWGIVRRFDLGDVIFRESLIYNTLIDLNKYVINVSMFDRIPTVVSQIPTNMAWNPSYKNLENSFGRIGQDAMILAQLASYMNFGVHLISRELDADNFGKVLENKTITGSLGDVAYRRADYAVNARFVDNPETKEYEYTMGFSSDRICIVVPKAKMVPEWRLIFKCFSFISWMGILLSLALYTVMLNIVRILKRRYLNHSVRYNFMVVLAILLAVSVKIPNAKEQRMLLTTWLAFSVIVSGIFQGTLFKSFSSTSYYPDINTFDDLDRSDLSIATSLDVFADGATEIVRRLRDKQIYIKGNSLKYTAEYRNMCAVERQNDGRLFLSTIYVTDSGSPLLHMMKECVVSYFVAQVVPYGSPYLIKINFILEKFVESGLIEKWYTDTSDGIMIQKRFSFKPSRKKRFYPLNVPVLSFAFYALFIGHLLAIILFCFELAIGKKTLPFSK